MTIVDRSTVPFLGGAEVGDLSALRNPTSRQVAHIASRAKRVKYLPTHARRPTNGPYSSQSCPTITSMPEQIGQLSDIRSACAWPACRRQSDARLEYAPLRTSGPLLRLPPGFVLSPQGGVVSLREEHAASFEVALGSERVRGVARLQ